VLAAIQATLTDMQCEETMHERNSRWKVDELVQAGGGLVFSKGCLSRVPRFQGWCSPVRLLVAPASQDNLCQT
jgi:hypothetical protein